MSRSSQGRAASLTRAAGAGAAAGVAGAAVMAVVEKLEQSWTHRPDSFVPGRTLLTLLGRRVGDRERPEAANLVMHYMTGAALGALRGVWSATGIRGTRANLTHTAARLATDQTLENASGAGAPPSTWPVREQLVDVGHKAVYSFITGMLSDALLRPREESRRGVISH